MFKCVCDCMFKCVCDCMFMCVCDCSKIVTRSNDDLTSVVIKLDYLAYNQSCQPGMRV